MLPVSLSSSVGSEHMNLALDELARQRYPQILPLRSSLLSLETIYSSLSKDDLIFQYSREELQCFSQNPFQALINIAVLSHDFLYQFATH